MQVTMNNGKSKKTHNTSKTNTTNHSHNMGFMSISQTILTKKYFAGFANRYKHMNDKDFQNWLEK